MDDGSTRTDGGSATEWHAGTATAVITPSESMWMAGFGNRDKPSEGVAQDLHAKVLALEDVEGNRTAIVSAEILFFDRRLRGILERRCEDEHGVEPRRLLLNASHTHQGPVTRVATDEVEDADGETRLVPRDDGSVNFFTIEFYGVDDVYRERVLEYREFLEETVVELVGEAFDALAPAELSYGHARCGSAMNRRRPNEDGIGFSPYSDGPVDHDVPVLAVEDPDATGDDALSAVLFGYACHPTTLIVYEFHGDWVGYTQEYLEERFPNATAIFLQGCGGDQKAYPEKELEYTKAHGRAVATAVEAALESVLRPVRGPVRAVYEEATIEFEEPPSREALEAMAESDEAARSARGELLLATLDEYGEIPTEYPYPVQALAFGTDLTLVAMAGEVLVGYSLRLKEELDGPLWTVGYSNNAFTYVPTAQVIYEGGYEGDVVIDMTSLPGKWKTDLEERIVSTAHTVVDRARTPPRW